MSRPFSVTRKFHFCAGHRILGHESKCSHPHGHNYNAFITISHTNKALPLDELGRVVDFSVLKIRLGEWIEKNWDHGFLYFAEDSILEQFLVQNNYKRYKLPYNPTAENMAEHLLEITNNLFANDALHCIKIVIEETENCKAEVTSEAR